MSIVAMFSLVACGPSAEEKRKKAEQDSLADQHTKDSLEQIRLEEEMKADQQDDTTNMNNDTTNATTAGTTTGTTTGTTETTK